MTELTLKPGTLTLAQLRAIHAAPVRLRLDASADQPINDSVACVEQILAEDRTAYGINTGFGLPGLDPHCQPRPGKPAALAGAVPRRRHRRAAG